MRAAGADPETALSVPLAGLAAGWPGDELWLAIDPAAEDGLALPPDAVPSAARLPRGSAALGAVRAGPRAPRLGAMIRRIDLRGGGRGHPRLPHPGAARRLRCRGRAARGAADLRRRARPRSRGDRGVLREVRRRRADRHHRAARGADRRPRRLDPEVRAGLEESIRRLRITCEAELEKDVVTDLGPGARVTQRLIPVDRVGLYVPGGVAPLVSSVIMNVVPAQVAGVGSIALTSSPQTRLRRAPAPHDPGGLRAARHRGGVRRRRRPGDRHVRLRRRPVPSRRPRHRAGQHLHGLGQAAAQGRRRDRLRGRVRPRSPSWPTTPPTRRTSPPTWSARPSTTRWPPRSWSPTRCGWPTRSRPSWTSRWPRPATSSGSAPRCRASSPASCSSTTWRRAST